MTDAKAKHRARMTDQKFLGLTPGQIVILTFVLLMIATVIVSIYIGKHI